MIYGVWERIPYEGHELMELYATRELAERGLAEMAHDDPGGRFFLLEHRVQDHAA